MLDILEQIICLVTNLVTYVLVGTADAANWAIAGLAAALSAAISLLPTLPDFPTLSDSSWWAWLNWAIPLSSYIGLAATLLTIFLSYFAARIALRWIKAL